MSLSSVTTVWSSHAGCNPGRSEFSTYKNCYIRFLCLCRFWTYSLELSTLIPSIIILATWTIPDTTEDDTRRAAVVTLLRDLARRRICNINTSAVQQLVQNSQLHFSWTSPFFLFIRFVSFQFCSCDRFVLIVSFVKFYTVSDADRLASTRCMRAKRRCFFLLLPCYPPPPKTWLLERIRGRSAYTCVWEFRRKR